MYWLKTTPAALSVDICKHALGLKKLSRVVLLSRVIPGCCFISSNVEDSKPGEITGGQLLGNVKQKLYWQSAGEKSATWCWKDLPTLTVVIACGV